ncbi:MAG: hypothetical protein AB8F95_02130 [Bacteroidia bacterium]
MKNLLLFGCIIILALASCKTPGSSSTTTTATPKDPEAIQDSTVRAIKRSFEANSPAASFDSFIKAISMGDGNSAVEMVSPETLDYYAALYGKVINSNAPQIQAMPVGTQMTILKSRILMADRGLKNMEPASFFKNLVETGAIDKIALKLIKLGNIETVGQGASASVTMNGVSASNRVKFSQSESGEWLINLSDILPESTQLYNKALVGKGIDVDAHLVTTLAPISQGGTFNQATYNPVR